MSLRSSPTLTKLNPTTITVPSPASNGKTLKLSFSPHLSIQSPQLDDLPNKIRKDADGLFEVVIPVGGRVEVDTGIEGIEHIKQGGTWYEYEIEHTIKGIVQRILISNREILRIDTIDRGSDGKLTLTPKAAAASQAMAIQNVIASSAPVAHLERLSFELTWTGTTILDENEPEGSSQGDQGGMTQNGNPVVGNTLAGPLPYWARDQIQTALAKLLRGELIRRFPLIFDSDFEQYLPRTVPSPSLLHSFNRCLQLSQTHFTPFLPEVRRRVHTLHRLLDAHARFRQEQVSSLTPSGRRRIRNSHPDDRDIAPVPSSDLRNAVNSQMANTDLPAVVREGDATLGSILTEALARIGRHRWTRLRSRARGRLSYNRVHGAAEVEQQSGVSSDRSGSFSHNASSGRTKPDDADSDDTDDKLMGYRGRFFDSDDDDELLDDDDDLFMSQPSLLKHSTTPGDALIAVPHTDGSELWLDDIIGSDQAQETSSSSALPSDLSDRCDEFIDVDLESMLSFSSPDDTQTSESQPVSLPASSSWVGAPAWHPVSDVMIFEDDSDVDSDLVMADDDKDTSMIMPAPFTDSLPPPTSELNADPVLLPAYSQSLDRLLLEGDEPLSSRDNQAFDFLTDSDEEL